MRKIIFAMLLTSACAWAQDNRYCSPANVWIGNSSDGPAALPQRCINTALVNTPSPGPVVQVSAAQDLLAAYRSAACGTILLLAHGASWTVKPPATFSFPAKNCDNQNWVTIKSDGTLPAEGTRVTQNDQAQMATFSFSPRNPPGNLGDHIRFIGVQLTKQPGSQLLAFFTGKDAKYIIFDRTRWLGNPKEETRRGFTINNGQYIGIIESDFEEFHCIAVTGACIDAQAISGGTGTGMPTSGPFKIVNNFLEASGENILFGGDAGDGCGPNDVEIRRNYMYKPMSWNPSDPNYAGVKYIVKNLFEVKNGCRILFEGNVMENNWGGFTQGGFAVLIGAKNQALGSQNVCPLCTATDVVFRYNHISKVGGFVGIGSEPNANGGWSLGLHRASVHDVLIDGIQYPTCFGCTNYLGSLGSGYIATNPPPPAGILSDVLVNHITQVSGLDLATGAVPLGWLQLNGPPPTNLTNTPTIQGVSWTNGISLAGQAGTFSSGGGLLNNCAVQPPGVRGTPANQLASCFHGTSQFSGNVFVAYPKPTTDWPAGNNFVADWPELGLVNYNGSFGGDYHLAFTSPVHGKALDGRDPGADIDMVNLFTDGVK